MAGEHTVEAQIPGLFYRRASPEADVFVNDGDKVSPEDSVGLVELMKSYYAVRAGVSGTVKQFLIENEEEVEPGQGVVVIELD